MLHSAIAVANYFVVKGVKENRPVDAMKLQKLLYFAHGWHLALYGEPLLSERVEAWSYGPVVPTAYREFKHNGRSPIEFPAFEWPGGRREASGPLFSRRAAQVTNARAVGLLDKIWEVYGGYSGTQLADMTHAKDGPWYQVWAGEAQRGAVRGIDIGDDLIGDYFKRIAVANRGKG